VLLFIAGRDGCLHQRWKEKNSFTQMIAENQRETAGKISVNQREKNTSLADYRRIKLAEERRDWRIDVGGWRMEFDSYLLSVISYLF